MTKTKYILYDYDANTPLAGVYDSYEEALDEIDPRMNNVIVLPLESPRPSE